MNSTHAVSRSLRVLLVIIAAGLLGRAGGAPSPSLDPVRPTFTGSVVASRTTTVAPGGVPGGTRVGGALDADVADVTSDGVPDLLTAGRAGDSVAGIPSLLVHAGRGDGTFDPPLVTTTSATAASRLVLTDLNRDGNLDVVLGGAGSPARYSALLGRGDGTFLEASTFVVSTPAITAGAGIVAALLNDDANPDIAVVATGGQVALVFGRGDGTFDPPALTPAGAGPRDLAAADLEPDGDVDLVVADATASGLVILRSNGNGTFAARTPMPLSFAPDRVAIVDLVGDSILDLLAAGAGGTEILLGKPLLNYSSAFSSTSGGLGVPAVLDADHDGNLDIVLGVPGTIFLGDGTGGFSPPPAGQFGADAGSFGSSVGTPTDLNGDGRLDLLTLSGGAPVSADRSVTPLLQRDIRLLNPRVASLLGIATGTPAGVVAADVNGDGYDDIATAFTSTVDGLSYVAVTLTDSNLGGPGPQLFVPTTPPGATNLAPAAIAAGDLDGDGTQDLVVANNFTSPLPYQIAILFGNRSAPLTTITYLPSSIFAPVGMAGLAAVTVGDFDGDGNLDIAGFQPGGGTPPALTPAQGCIHLGNGKGGFAPAGLVTASRTNSAHVPAGDLNGDLRDELVLRLSPTVLSVLPAMGGGLFGAPVPVGVSAGAGEAIGDVDGDGRNDLIVFPAAAVGGADLAVLRGLGGITFGAPLRSTAATPDAGGGAVVLADLNGDGLVDIATDGAVGADLGVFVQRTDGLFVHLSLATLTEGSGLAAGDLDRDGRIDLVNVGVRGAAPIFHEWFRNTTLDVPSIRDADEASARRGGALLIDVRIRDAGATWRADLGPDVDIDVHEFRGGEDWRLHVVVQPVAVPGVRDLVAVRPDGEEGANGLEGATSVPERGVLRILEEGVGPFLKRVKYPNHDKGWLPAGEEDFRLKLKGSGFESGAVVLFGSAEIETKSPKKGGKKLKADVSAALVQAPRIVEVRVVNPTGPPSNALEIPVIGPELDEGSLKLRSDGRIEVKLKGRNLQKSGFEVAVRRLDTGGSVPVQSAKRTSKKKIKLKLAPATPLAPGTQLEFVVSYLGSLGNRIASDPLLLSAP